MEGRQLPHERDAAVFAMSDHIGRFIERIALTRLDSPCIIVPLALFLSNRMH
jgi:hypothetical protein